MQNILSNTYYKTVDKTTAKSSLSRSSFFHCKSDKITSHHDIMAESILRHINSAITANIMIQEWRISDEQSWLNGFNQRKNIFSEKLPRVANVALCSVILFLSFGVSL
jgi:GH35 family endo-1,4-beta-xylanase